MKMYLASFTSVLAIVALGQAGAALPAAAQSTEPYTIAHSWRIEHDNLLRGFSQGLGVDLGASL